MLLIKAFRFVLFGSICFSGTKKEKLIVSLYFVIFVDFLWASVSPTNIHGMGMASLFMKMCIKRWKGHRAKERDRARTVDKV